MTRQSEMGAVFSSARGGDVLRHSAETISLILRALQSWALTGMFRPCVSIPSPGRWQSWGNAVNSPGFMHKEQAGLSPAGSAGIRDVPLGISAPRGEESCAGQGGSGSNFLLILWFFWQLRQIKARTFQSPLILTAFPIHLLSFPLSKKN